MEDGLFDVEQLAAMCSENTKQSRTDTWAVGAGGDDDGGAKAVDEINGELGGHGLLQVLLCVDGEAGILQMSDADGL